MRKESKKKRMYLLLDGLPCFCFLLGDGFRRKVLIKIMTQKRDQGGGVKKGGSLRKKQQQPGRLCASELRGLCRLPPTPLLLRVGKEEKERKIHYSRP